MRSLLGNVFFLKSVFQVVDESEYFFVRDCEGKIIKLLFIFLSFAVVSFASDRYTVYSSKE
jgi:hypothetical protein